MMAQDTLNRRDLVIAGNRRDLTEPRVRRDKNGH
jgi:hypothetical protein